MNEGKLSIKCEECGEVRAVATSFEHEMLEICADCWPEYAEENGLCEECGSELAAEYEDMHPDGIGYYQVVGYKPCADCAYVEE